jgi:hypothetical protein
MPGAFASLALAGSAAVILTLADAIGFASETAEVLFVPAWISGWALLVWAAALGGICAIRLVLRLVVGRGTAPSDALILAAAAAVVVVIVSTHHLWGAGSGSG